jgi:hypothetical protein
VKFLDWRLLLQDSYSGMVNIIDIRVPGPIYVLLYINELISRFWGAEATPPLNLSRDDDYNAIKSRPRGHQDRMGSIAGVSSQADAWKEGAVAYFRHRASLLWQTQN